MTDSLGFVVEDLVDSIDQPSKGINGDGKLFKTGKE